ncbi:hypothetical protein GVX76_02845 [[Haemophilus] felis]|nr:hypothetical protein [[Haemophilus] felis]
MKKSSKSKGRSVAIGALTVVSAMYATTAAGVGTPAIVAGDAEANNKSTHHNIVVGKEAVDNNKYGDRNILVWGKVYGIAKPNDSDNGDNIIIGANARGGSTGARHNRQTIAIGSAGEPFTLDNSKLNDDKRTIANIIGKDVGGSTGGAWARGDQSIAIGANTVAFGDSSIVIGGDDVDSASLKDLKYKDKNGNESTTKISEGYEHFTGKGLIRNDERQWSPAVADDLGVTIGSRGQGGVLSVVVGASARGQKLNSVALGAGATVEFENGVALGAGSYVDENNKGTKQTKSKEINGVIYDGWAGGDKVAAGDVVSIGSKDHERQLKNVAAGEVSENSTDAINGSQLFSVAKNQYWNLTIGKTGTGENIVHKTTDTTAGAAPNAIVDGGSEKITSKNGIKIIAGNGIQIDQEKHEITISVNKDTLLNAVKKDVLPNLATKGDVYQINKRVDRLDNRLRGVGANAAAAAALPQVYLPGRSMVAAAVGTYGGASAIAVGFSRASDNGKVVLKLHGTANTENEFSGGAGLGYQW